MSKQNSEANGVGKVAECFDRLVDGPLREFSSPFHELLQMLLSSDDYFDLPTARCAADARLRRDFRTLESYRDQNLDETGKTVLQERMKAILEKHLVEALKQNKIYDSINIKDQILMNRMPRFRMEENSDFIEAFENLVTGDGAHLIPCRVLLFGPFAHGRGSRESYCNIAIVSDAFGGIDLAKRKRFLRRLMKTEESLLTVIGITPDESEGKYTLGKVKFLFQCRRQPGKINNWDLEDKIHR